MAEKIPDPVVADERNFVDKNPGSMFLTAVDDREILDFVNKCKSKTSTDCDDVDMYVVKMVIEGSLKPLTYICNLSFQTGTFANERKVA